MPKELIMMFTIPSHLHIRRGNLLLFVVTSFLLTPELDDQPRSDNLK